MAIEFTRLPNSTDIYIRVTQDVFTHRGHQQFIDEMNMAICQFVQTDPEVRILINEMVRTAFEQVDLLKLVTETIKQSLLNVSKPVTEVPSV